MQRKRSRSRAEGEWETRSVFQGGLIADFSSAADGCVFVRRPVRECRVRPVIVLVMAPQGQLAASIGQGEEDFDVQAFIAQLAVEALNVAVLDRLARPDEVRCTPFL